MNKSSEQKILVANGVNLDLLGKRQPHIYGSSGLVELENKLKIFNQNISSLYEHLFELYFFQSNSEVDFLNKLTEQAWNAMIINPGAWTHTSLALADRLAAIDYPFIEVHLSNTAAREDFRNKSFSAPHAVGVVYGLGFDSYTAALSALYNLLSNFK